MTPVARPPVSRRLRGGAAAGSTLVALLTVGMLSALGGPARAATAVPLGTATTFAVLAGSGITNTGPTTITGDIGTHPTPAMKGIQQITLDGANHGSDAVTQGAKADLVEAYNAARDLTPTQEISDDLGGRTLRAGVYHAGSSMGLTGTLTLNAAGDPDAVFVFQMGSTLTTASASRVVLTNRAQACNVFWQVGSSATLGTSSTFRGTVMAMESITVTRRTVVYGRMLARGGAVTLDTNTITRSGCAAAGSTGSATPSETATATGGTATPTTGTPTPDATPTSSAAATPRPTRPQVTRRPVGPVDTGDGSPGDPSTGAVARVAGAIALGAAGASALVLGLRRRSTR